MMSQVDMSLPADEQQLLGHTSSKRGKTGCITCRLRKKRCDETKPLCATCTRLGIECMGYGIKRPDWLRQKENARKAKQEIKATVMSKRFKRAKTAESTVADDKDSSCDQRVGSHDSERSESLSIKEMVLEDVPPPFEMSSRDEQKQSVNPRKRPEAPKDSDGREGQVYSMDEDNFSRWATANQEFSDYYAGDLRNFQSSAGVLDTLDPAVLMTNDPNESILQPLSDPSAPSLPLISTNTAIPANEGMDELWSTIFGSVDPAFWGTNSPQTTAVPKSPESLSSYLMIPAPTAGLSPGNSDRMRYLHHYLNVVLPLQYRMLNISISMSDFVAPLALSFSEVFDSVSSLAALHMVSQRTKKRVDITTADYSARLSVIHDALECDPSGSATIDEFDDDDTRMAVSAHQKAVERLRFLSPQDLTAEGVIVSALFAISYHLFSGGTSKQLKEMILINQRCLSAALSSSPEFSEGHQSHAPFSADSPWSRYRPLIEHMIWIDVIASVSNGKGSRLLPTYRRILKHLPTDSNMGMNRPFLQMDKIMGCDSTTLLAIAEIVALSEWKEKAQRAGCLSYIDLIYRSSAIQKLLDERAWRECHLDQPSLSSSEQEDTNDSMRRIMTDIFFGSARVLLACVINGPFPRVPEIAQGVQDTLEALNRLDIEHPDADIHRALVLPITIAGCHCHTPQQQAFFKSCFGRLSVEARAFGNTGPALELMEEVWKRRATKESDEAVCWRETMTSLGWENGILLI
ncbi:hypothetical protein C356_05516 [Cryptococcus neoformans c45]|nr:hypothetical protein C356_05516 [Cryptococcus neoformans var. grubii c45]